MRRIPLRYSLSVRVLPRFMGSWHMAGHHGLSSGGSPLGWFIAYMDYTWGQSTRGYYANELRLRGGDVVGTTAVPVGTTDMRPLLSSIGGPIQGLLGIFVGEDAIAFGRQAYDLGLTKKYRWAGDGGLAVPRESGPPRRQDRRVRRHRPLRPGVREHPQRRTTGSGSPRSPN